MAECMWTSACIFFTDEVGYSPELWGGMKHTYCLGDSAGCARLRLMDFVPAEEVPDDLIPTDSERVDEIVAGLSPLDE